MASKKCRPWSPTQSFLLPPSPLEWLPAGHLAYFVLDVVATLDVREIEAAIDAKDPRGERPYQPAMMLALLVYAYCVGIFSSRKIARATFEDVAFRVLAGSAHPHFTTINQFRLDHRTAFAGLFVQVLRLCQKAGMVKLGHVAFDGSKIAANASKHKAMSYQRMSEQEERLTREVEELLARADAADQRDDEKHGVGCAPEDVPAELQRREERLARIREAKAALQAEAAQARADELRERADEQRAKAADESVDAAERERAATRAAESEKAAAALRGDDPPTNGAAGGDGSDLPSHRVPHQADGTPAPTAQRNFTDADSRIMKKDGAFVQGYNAQTAVDSESQVIVGEAVTNQAPDCEHLLPMIDRVEATCRQKPTVVSADAGYFSRDNVAACERRGVDPHIAVGRERKGATSASPDPVREQMRTKLLSGRGKAIYARRKTIVEPPFGQIKQARGFRRFSLRGLAKVRTEWTFVCLTHNLLKLFRAPLSIAPAPVAA